MQFCKRIGGIGILITRPCCFCISLGIPGHLHARFSEFLLTGVLLLQILIREVGMGKVGQRLSSY